MSKPVELDDIWKISSQAAYRQVASETVIVNTRSSKMMSLNETGGVVWGALDGERSLGDVVGVVEAHFEVSRAQAARDVVAFVTQLVERGLVERVLPTGAQQAHGM